MKNFSLKALGAILFAAGLVLAGVAAPAQAANGITMITSPAPTFESSTSITPAFEIAIENSSGFSDPGSGDQLSLKIDGSGASASGSWNLKSGCAATYTNYATSGCGIASISATAGTLGTVQVKKSSTYGEMVIKGLGNATAISIQFQANAFQTAAGYGTYVLSAKTGQFVSVGTLNLTVASPPPPQNYTVTFNANGGSGTMANQTASGNVQLSRNVFTKSGTTFSGWSTTCNGRLEAMDQEPYTFNEDATLFAVWADGSNACSSGGGGSSATANLTLNATTGQLVAGSSVAVAASGLQSTAAYEVVVRSTPQTIGTGNAVSGAVNTTVTLPAGLEAGWHSLTFSSTAADGSAMTSVAYFKVSASGTLLATSTTIPAELANTGVDSTSAILLLAGGLSLALVGAEMFMIARRKRSN